MTEELRQWAMKQVTKKWPSPHIDQQAEYWAKRVFKAIKQRVDELEYSGVVVGPEKYIVATDQLKKEWFDDK